MTDSQQYFFTIVSITAAIPAVIYLLSLSRIDSDSRLIGFYVGLQLIGEAVSYLTGRYGNNLSFMFVYSLIEVLVLSGFFWKVNKKNSAIAIITILLLFVFCLEAYLYGNLSNDYPFARSMSHIWFSVLSLRMMHSRFKNMKVYNVMNDSLFIISVGLLVYYLTSALFIGLKPIYSDMSLELVIRIFVIRGILVIISRLLISVALWVGKFKRY